MKHSARLHDSEEVSQPVQSISHDHLIMHSRPKEQESHHKSEALQTVPNISLCCGAV